MEKLRVGVVGCGYVARVAHIRWYLQNPNVGSVCVAEPLNERLDFCLKRWRIDRGYADPAEMLEKEELDVVSICTHVQKHCEHTVAAAERGVRGILCEKPMAPSLEECDRMIEACRGNGVTLQIGFMKRFNPGHQAVKALISEGELGAVQLAWVYWGFGGLAPRTKAEVEQRLRSSEALPPELRGRLYEHGGMVMDHGCHYADVFRWWVGEVDSVSAQISPSTLAALRFENGAMGVFADAYNVSDLFPTREGGYLCSAEATLRFDVPPWTSYEDMTIRLTRGRDERLISPFDVIKDEPERGAALEPPMPYIDFSRYMFKREIDGFVDSVVAGRDPVVTGRDGRAATEIVLDIFKSADEERTVNLPLGESLNMGEVYGRAWERTARG